MSGDYEVYGEYEEKIGAGKIADDVIAICAVNATLKTKGVSDLSPVFADSFSKNILGKTPLHRGVKVAHEDGGVTLDIFVIVEYGVKIPAVAWDIQENVKKEIEEMTAFSARTVNIHIQGVRGNGAAMAAEVGADE